jgi:hypothetical protein
VRRRMTEPCVICSLVSPAATTRDISVSTACNYASGRTRKSVAASLAASEDKPARGRHAPLTEGTIDGMRITNLRHVSRETRCHP